MQKLDSALESLPALTVVKKHKTVIKSFNTGNAKEIEKAKEVPMQEWIMPPQPAAYIKCRRHDFL